MKTNSQIRKDALEFFKANWGSATLVMVVYMAITSVISTVVYIFSNLTTTVFSAIGTETFEEDWAGQLMGALMGVVAQSCLSIPLNIFVQMPLMVAVVMVFLQLVRMQKLQLGGIFTSLKQIYFKSVGVMLLINIYTYLWSLLFVIPGIVKNLSYSMAPYILAENPHMKVGESINLSMEMMDGHKGELFLMMLGFVGLTLLSFVLCGLPLIILIPYYQVVMTKFYLEVKADYERQNISVA